MVHRRVARGIQVGFGITRFFRDFAIDFDGQKCDRCWNYSTHVGESAQDPTICDRWVEALAGTF